MNRLLIYGYINKLRKEDIINYCNNNGIVVSDNELDIVYSYIKNDYKKFFNNPTRVLNEVKDKVSDNNYMIIMELYEKYKRFI